MYTNSFPISNSSCLSSRKKSSDKYDFTQNRKEEQRAIVIEQRTHDTSLGERVSGLVVIARNATGEILTRITSRHDLVGAIQTARSVLKLKADAICTEVHVDEGPASDYHQSPLAMIKRDDLLATQTQAS